MVSIRSMAIGVMVVLQEDGFVCQICAKSDDCGAEAW